MSLPVNWLWVLVVGGLLTFLVGNLPPAKKLAELRYTGSLVSYFGKLFECSLCLGTWISFILCCFFGVSVGPYIPVVSEAITAAIFSFITHIFLLGLKTKWGVWE